MSVGQVREPSADGAGAEAVEGAEGNVLFVHRPPRGAAQVFPGEGN
jgi:hypothetical protein